MPESRKLRPVLNYPGLLLALMLTLSACGKPTIISSPVGKTRVSPPVVEQAPSQAAPPSVKPSPPPAGAKVPATQRPYKIKGKTYYPIPSAQGFKESGIASWYGGKFHGRRTSNGEVYDMNAMTAAHKTLPMNTHLLVTNLENGREVTVRVNDRGPFVRGRIIDLSRRAADELDISKQGLGRVEITALGEAVTYQEDGKTRTRFAPTPDFEYGEFFVQVGSFTNRENAERLRDQLNQWDRPSIVREYDHGGRIFHRVQVKAGNELSAARHLERVLVEAGFHDAFVVAR